MKYLSITTIQHFLDKIKTYVLDRINAIPDPMHYAGTWDASTNTPTLAQMEEGKSGYIYRVSVAGTQFGMEFKAGDRLVYNESGQAEKWDTTDEVYSVNGQTGDVELEKTDVGLGNVDNTSDVDKPLSNAAKTEFAKTLKNYGAISANTDLNNLLTEGMYGVGTGTQEGIKNKPVSGNHTALVVVYNGGEYRTQLYVVTGGSITTNVMYRRVKSTTSNWSTWKEVGSGGGSVNVVQESGDSTVDVMSQKAVTDFVNTSINGIGAMKTFYANNTESLIFILKTLGNADTEVFLQKPYMDWMMVIPQQHLVPSFRIVYNAMQEGAEEYNSSYNFFKHLFEYTGIELFESNPFMRGSVQVDVIPAMPLPEEGGASEPPRRFWLDCTFMRTYDHTYDGNQLMNVDGWYASGGTPAHPDTSVYHIRFLLQEDGIITYWGAWKQSLTEVPIPEEPRQIN